MHTESTYPLLSVPLDDLGELLPFCLKDSLLLVSCCLGSCHFCQRLPHHYLFTMRYIVWHENYEQGLNWLLHFGRQS